MAISTIHILWYFVLCICVLFVDPGAPPGSGQLGARFGLGPGLEGMCPKVPTNTNCKYTRIYRKGGGIWRGRGEVYRLNAMIRQGREVSNDG